METQKYPRIVVVLAVGAAFTIAMAGIQAVAELVGPAFLALVLTITVHPLRRRLRATGMPDWLASTLMVLVAYFVLIALALALVVSVARTATLVPEYSAEIRSTINDFTSQLSGLGIGEEQIDAIADAFDLGSLLSAAGEILSSALGIVSGLVFILTLLLFLAFDTTRTNQVMESIHARRPYFIDAMRSFALGTRNYMAVSAGFGLIVAIIDVGALWLLGIPAAFVWGVLAFVTNFIPNIGFVIGVIPPALIGLLEGGPGLMLVVIAVYSVINFLIQSVIQPRVVGDRVGLSATITFLSLVFWAWAIGPLGALLAVPLTLLVRATLVEADPDARWVLPLIASKPEEKAVAPETPPAPETPAQA
ncbi:AI-2E family transporter [Nocardioides insulae]|uniref:AI-2E family transporter n=1 Tax=Nocardioides insulae TaxID=394734 RepID=UPI0004202575|nr:AI-2E family transporter [Nocardioides insulae]